MSSHQLFEVLVVLHIATLHDSVAIHPQLATHPGFSEPALITGLFLIIYHRCVITRGTLRSPATAV